MVLDDDQLSGSSQRKSCLRPKPLFSSHLGHVQPGFSLATRPNRPAVVSQTNLHRQIGGSSGVCKGCDPTPWRKASRDLAGQATVGG